MTNQLFDYFTLYGPFAILFIILFYWTLSTYKTREELYRQEAAQLRAESEEHLRRHYEALAKFADKYELILSEIQALKSQMERRPSNK